MSRGIRNAFLVTKQNRPSIGRKFDALRSLHGAKQSPTSTHGDRAVVWYVLEPLIRLVHWDSVPMKGNAITDGYWPKWHRAGEQSISFRAWHHVIRIELLLWPVNHGPTPLIIGQIDSESFQERGDGHIVTERPIAHFVKRFHVLPYQLRRVIRKDPAGATLRIQIIFPILQIE
jgi:hypothetical protein